MTHKRSDLHIYGRLLHLARPYWLHLVGVFLLSLLATPIALLVPLPLKIGVDSLLNGQPVPGWFTSIFFLGEHPSGRAVVMAVSALVVLVAIAGQFQEVASSFLATLASQRLILGFRTLLFRSA